jgi:valyl-tRNA synthetase
MLLCSPAGNDLLYDDSLPEQGRNFANKIWNAFRLVITMDTDDSIPQPPAAEAAVRWMDAIINRTLAEIDDSFSRYRISDALMQTYKLFWDDFSGWYLEIIKPAYKKPMDGKTHRDSLRIFEALMKIIHPFMPFITEEIWQKLGERADGSSIMIERMPEAGKYDAAMLSRFDTAREIVSAVRTIRKENNIPNRDPLVLCAAAGSTGEEFDEVIKRMCNLSEIRIVAGKVEGAVSFRIHTSEFFVPFGEGVDHDEEIRKMQEELKYTEGFLAAVVTKLSNDKFVANAPAKVLELEKRKEADARAKIATLTESLSLLEKNRGD